MALETSTYIDGLVATNPTSTDNVGDGDNHIRLLKSTIKATFPNITGAVTGTHTAINSAVSTANAATNANTASTIVKRDSSGNFSAGTITGALTGNVTGNLTGNVTGNVTGTSGSTTGNAATATALATSRTIALSGDVTGSASFNGSANATITATVVNNSHTHTISNVSGLQSALDAKTTLADAKLAAHPVNSIYISISSTNPASLFGGTWVSFGAGRVLVGLDSGDSDFNQAEEMGGAKTHTLSIAEMPSHNHTYTYEYSRGVGSAGAANGDSSFPTGTTSSTGGGAAHNNVQPYIVVYMWKRTA